MMDDEKPDICSDCDYEPGSCSYDQEVCIQEAAEQDAENRYEGLREC